MKEQVKIFMKKMQEDKSLEQKFSSVKNPEELTYLVEPYLNGLSSKEFLTELVSAYEEIQKNEDKNEVSGTQVLSEDDLDEVSGGVSQFWKDFGKGFKIGFTETLKVGVSIAKLII